VILIADHRRPKSKIDDRSQLIEPAANLKVSDHSLEVSGVAVHSSTSHLRAYSPAGSKLSAAILEKAEDSEDVPRERKLLAA
jgi:hypothetical protein